MNNQEDELVISGGLDRLPLIATYIGNRNLKKTNVLIEYSEHQIEEIAKCSQDPVYFISNYCHVIDPNKGKIQVTLRDYQENLISHIANNRFSAIMAPRQSGKSLSASLYITWYTLFHPYKASAILANKEKIAKAIFKKVQLAFENLPYWLQMGVKRWDAMSFELENGSSVECAATSSSSIRGLTINGLLLVDEFAFLPKGIVEDFWDSIYPTIEAAEESRIAIVSTPNGLNHFHTLWQKAIKGKNDFAHYQVPWNAVPGRDEEWLAKTIANLGEVKTSKEYLCKFIGSSKTIIKSAILEVLEAEEPLRTIYDNCFKIYEDPIKGHTYAIGGDVAKGTGGDYSCLQVLDITDKNNIKQVAVYGSNEIGTYDFANICVEISKMYNEAYLIIENNDVGSAVLSTIWDTLEYEYVVDYANNNVDMGIRATKKTKSLALDNMKHQIDKKKISIIDETTKYELSVFVELRSNIYGAISGEHDDRVSALYWALFYNKLPEFFDEDDIKERLEESTPLPHFPDARNEDEEAFLRDLIR